MTQYFKDKINTLKEDKMLQFHNNRNPENFPRVHFDINDLEFCDLLHEIDHIYKSVFNLNKVFVKYSTASLSNFFNSLELHYRYEQDQQLFRSLSSQSLPLDSCEPLSLSSDKLNP